MACEASAPSLKRPGRRDPGTHLDLRAAPGTDRPSVRFKLPALCREDGTWAQRRDSRRGSQARANDNGLRLREGRCVQGDNVTSSALSYLDQVDAIPRAVGEGEACTSLSKA